MTKKQQKVLSFIEAFHSLTGEMPNFHTIQFFLGKKSKNSVSQYMDSLVKEGALSKSPRHVYRLNNPSIS